MSSVYRETTVTLTEEERALLKQAIFLCQGIANDCNDEDLFVDASTIFSCVFDSYKDGEIPSIVHIFE